MEWREGHLHSVTVDAPGIGCDETPSPLLSSTGATGDGISVASWAAAPPPLLEPEPRVAGLGEAMLADDRRVHANVQSRSTPSPKAPGVLRQSTTYATHEVGDHIEWQDHTDAAPSYDYPAASPVPSTAAATVESEASTQASNRDFYDRNMEWSQRRKERLEYSREEQVTAELKTLKAVPSVNKIPRSPRQAGEIGSPNSVSSQRSRQSLGWVHRMAPVSPSAGGEGTTDDFLSRTEDWLKQRTERLERMQREKAEMEESQLHPTEPALPKSAKLLEKAAYAGPVSGELKQTCTHTQTQTYTFPRVHLT